RDHLLPALEEGTEGGEGEVVRESPWRFRGRQLEELSQDVRVALGPLIQLVAAPEVTGRLVAPLLPDGAARVRADHSGHHEDQLVGLILRGQAAELLDLLAGVGQSELPHPFTLEDGAPAVLPGHHVAPAFAARFAEV